VAFDDNFRDRQGRVQRVGSYAVCTDDTDRILLCRLTAATSRPGWWTLPGGGIDFGEDPRAALVRELEEETGLVGEPGELLTVDSLCRVVSLPHAPPTEYHAIRVVYRAVITGGELRHEQAGSSDRAQWHHAAEVASLQLTEIAELGVILSGLAPSAGV